MADLESKNYAFGEFRIETLDMTLWRGAEKLPLPIKAVEVLVVLVENLGRTVSKEELMERVWPETFVDENNLAVMISRLRRALSDNDPSRKFIETVPRRGYRLVDPTADRNSSNVAEGAKGSASFRPRARAVGLALFVLGCLALTAIPLLSLKPKSPRPAFATSYSLPSNSGKTKSVLILPFAEEDVNDPHVGTDVASGLIARIGRLNYFHMRPLPTFVPPEVLKDLHIEQMPERADFVIEGVVQRNPNDKVAVSAKLFDVRTQTVIWQGKKTAGIFVEVLDEVAAAITESALNSLDETQRSLALSQRPTSLAAYTSYSVGVEKFRRRQQCFPFFEDAVRLDPEFADAHAMLAIVSAFSGWSGSSRNVSAKNLVAKAFALDPASPYAFAAQGFIQVFHEADWEGGEKSFRTALEIDPFNVEARHWLSILLAFQRRLDEAKTEMAKALESDPTSATLLTDYAELHYYSYDYEKARDLNNLALSIQPDHHFAVGNSARFDPRISFFKDDQREIALLDVEKKAGDPQANSFGLGVINVDPRYDFIRNEPRFQAVIKKLKLDKYK